MFDAILGLANISPIKLGLILAIVTALLGYHAYDNNNHFQAGYDEAESKYLKELNLAQIKAQEATEALLKAHSDKLEQAVNKAKLNQQLALTLQQQLDGRPSAEIRYEIEKVNTTSCNNLGDDFKRVFNLSLGTAPIITRSNK